MTTTDKLPAGWVEGDSYESYFRRMGPLTLRVSYSCPSQTYDAMIESGDTLICTTEEKIDSEAPDFDRNAMLRDIYREAQRIVRSWAMR